MSPSWPLRPLEKVWIPKSSLQSGSTNFPRVASSHFSCLCYNSSSCCWGCCKYLLVRKQLVLIIKWYHLLPRELCDMCETEKLPSVLSSAVTLWLHFIFAPLPPDPRSSRGCASLPGRLSALVPCLWMQKPKQSNHKATMNVGFSFSFLTKVAGVAHFLSSSLKPLHGRFMIW